MLKEFSTATLKAAHEQLKNAHLAPPIEALARALVPFAKEMLELELKTRPDEQARPAAASPPVPTKR